MYLAQKIDVNLTTENAEILRRPSKVFNKIKTLFSGEMTPTEKKQAEVMLSVLQRLNVALRNTGLDRLAGIVVNEDVVYDDNVDSESNLGEGKESLADKLYNGDLNRIDTLSLTVDGEGDELRYLIHVYIQRKPKKSDSPVRVDIFGFINEFKKNSGESEIELAERVKSLIEVKWSDESKRKIKLDSLENIFEKQVSKLKSQIDIQFPAKSTLNDSKRLLRQQPFKSHYVKDQARYNDSWAYFPIFFEYYSHDDISDELNNLKLEVDQSEYWDYESSTAVLADDSSWTDSISFSDASAGESSCGSNCGGGCGGS